MIQLQQLLQREKSHKEVAARLQQHLDVRPAPPSSFSVAGMVIGLVLALVLFLFTLLNIFLFTPRSVSLIGGILILTLAAVALALDMLLPLRLRFTWSRPSLSVLLTYGWFAGCISLAFALLPDFDFFVIHDRNTTALFVGVIAAIAVGMPSMRLSWRKFATESRANLLQTYLELEQITLTSKHLLRRYKDEKQQTALEKATQADIPRFYLARHPDGTYTVAFKEGLPIPVMQRLAEMQPKTAFTDHEAVQRILEEDAPCEDIWTGKIYTFPETTAPQDYPNVTSMVILWDHGWEAGEQEEEDEEDEEKPEKPDAGEWDTPLLAYVVNERIVVGCRAQKINEVAAEAWVQPEPSDRNEARQVTLAWASTMRRSGKIPFFSHHNDDEGAADLARGLGLSLVVEEIDYY